MTIAIISFLVMMNPFALFLYLKPVMADLTNRDFNWVFFKASLISYLIYVVFFLTGDWIFQRVFLISFGSFRIFGGIVIFTFAYLFIVKGEVAFLQMKGTLDDLASQIALPFMVGAGTISLAILMSHTLSVWKGIAALTISMTVNYVVIVGLKGIRDRIHDKWQVAFDKNTEILLRLNGFFLGSIGVNMTLLGIRQVFNI